MKKYFLILPLFVFLSSYLLGQEIDQSIIENLSPEQIEQAKEVLKSNNSVISESEILDEEKESLEKRENDDVSIAAGYKFGYNFISSSPTSIVASSDLPFPNDYKISIGDLIGVVLSGSKEQIFDLKVQLNGTIFFPELGSISVAGESFTDVKNKLKNLIKQSYIGVEIDLSLKNLSAKKITIVGTVNNPGTYLVNPFTTISNSLAYSGGVNSIGSLRTIKLIRINGETFTFDLYDLLIEGDRTKDITIESGDVIIVGAANKFIEISGKVKRPGIYEILPNENLSDLLRYSLGFAGGANVTNIAVNQLNINTSIIETNITDNLQLDLNNVLDIKVFSYVNDNNSNIQVFGAVNKPGFYRLNEFNTLAELIEKMEFVDVYPWLAVLEQFDENNLIKSSILFSLKDPSTYESIELLPNSRVYFADIDARGYPVEKLTKDKIDDYAVRINHKQGSYTMPVYGRFKIESFINFLGLDMSDVDEIATYISPLNNTIIQESYTKMDFEAQKYNTVSFRSLVNDLIRVTIAGEIDYPGTYTLSSNSTLEDLYSLVGSFKKEAFMEGIIFMRESVRQRQIKSIEKSRQDLNEAILVSTQRGENIGDINIIRALSQTIDPENLGRIAGDFSPESSSSISTILFDGDKIIIPKNPNVINVLGEVLNPIAFEYKKRITVREAIENAGGYKDYAQKNGVYVIKANGITERVNRNIFVRNIKLEPGDTVVIPRKIITNNPGIEALLPVTKILSDLAFSAAAIEGLSRN